MYVEKAVDPLVREESKSGRSKMRQQLRPIWEKESIEVGGEMVRLCELGSLDNQARILAGRGLSRQHGKGLVHIIDQVMLDAQATTVQECRGLVDRICELGKSLSA